MDNPDNALENAEDIITRFGGIRPMATKTGVAVTTIQGWKKRGAIPAARRDLVLRAAKDHDIDLSDVLGQGSVANDVGETGEGADVKSAEKTPLIAPVRAPEKPVSADAVQAGTAADWHRELAKMEKRVLRKSLLINAGLLGLVAGAAVVLLLPAQKDKINPLEEARFGALEKDISQLQKDVDGVAEEQTALGQMVPRELDARFAALQAQTAQVKESLAETVNQKIEDTKARAQNFVLENEQWAERLASIDSQMQALGLSGSPLLASLMARYELLTASAEGQALLGQSTSDLAAALDAFGDGATNIAPDGAALNLNDALEAARTESEALGQSLANVPQEDLKAAALLLAMSKFRESLHRGNEPFEKDYRVLRKLIGDDNPALHQSLDRLAPHAQNGVLTPAGLSAELRGLTGEIIMASLQGEDVSVKERAAARFNDVLQVEKDGALVTGTDTQATVLKAEQLLGAGDLEGAIAQMQMLEGDAAVVASSWLKKAKATALAGEVQGFISQAMNVRAFGAPDAASDLFVKGGAGAGGELIQYKDYGVNVLKGAKPAQLR